MTGLHEGGVRDVVSGAAGLERVVDLSLDQGEGAVTGLHEGGQPASSLTR